MVSRGRNQGCRQPNTKNPRHPISSSATVWLADCYPVGNPVVIIKESFDRLVDENTATHVSFFSCPGINLPLGCLPNGCVIQTRQLWSGTETGLAQSVSQNELTQN